jgi:hypothetical protein
MHGDRHFGLLKYGLAIWGVLLLVSLIIALSGWLDVYRTGKGVHGTFLLLGAPIFLLGLGVPVLLLKALSRWSRDVEGDESQFNVRDIPAPESPHPVTYALPQDGGQPPVGTAAHLFSEVPVESAKPPLHPQPPTQTPSPSGTHDPPG